MLGKSTIAIAAILLTLGILTRACDLDHMRNGCRIINAQCSCGFGCKSEYRYDNHPTCQMALRGRKHDICNQQKPCLHNGSCLQISQAPGFKCQCESTGYYGVQCEQPCPGPNNPRTRGPFPHECIVI